MSKVNAVAIIGVADKYVNYKMRDFQVGTGSRLTVRVRRALIQHFIFYLFFTLKKKKLKKIGLLYKICLA